MNGEKQALFASAVASYRAHDQKKVAFGNTDFPNLVNRFGLGMPPKLALEAIDEILSKSKNDAQDGGDFSISLGGSEGSARSGGPSRYGLGMTLIVTVFLMLVPSPSFALLAFGNLCALFRGDWIKSRKTLLNVRTLAVRADHFLLPGLSQGQDLGKRLLASSTQIFVCGHFRLQHLRTFYSAENPASAMLQSRRDPTSLRFCVRSRLGRLLCCPIDMPESQFHFGTDRSLPAARGTTKSSNSQFEPQDQCCSGTATI